MRFLLKIKLLNNSNFIYIYFFIYFILIKIKGFKKKISKKSKKVDNFNIYLLKKFDIIINFKSFRVKRNF